MIKPFILSKGKRKFAGKIKIDLNHLKEKNNNLNLLLEKCPDD